MAIVGILGKWFNLHQTNGCAVMETGKWTSEFKVPKRLRRETSTVMNGPIQRPVSGQPRQTNSLF